MIFRDWYKKRYLSGCARDYAEYDYYDNENSFIEGWWLDRELEEAFKAGQDFQRQKEYEFEAF